MRELLLISSAAPPRVETEALGLTTVYYNGKSVKFFNSQIKLAQVCPTHTERPQVVAESGHDN